MGLEIFIGAVIIGLVPAAIAKSKGRSFLAFWIYGALLFIAALPHALLMKATSKAAEESALADGGKKCPFCAEVIKAEAKVCRYCGKDLPIFERKSVQVTPTGPETPTEFVKDLPIDNQNRIRCPLCKAGIRLDSEELQANQFRCTSCKTVIGFTPHVCNQNAWT